MSKKMIGLLIAAILVIVLAVWAVLDSQKEDRALNKMALGSTVDFLPTDEGLAKGELAPDFELTTLKGEKMRLSDYRGKAVILNFWATWCPPCRAEMPHMQTFYENQQDKDVEVVAVNLTTEDRGMTEIENFVEEFGLSFSIPMDVDGDVGALYQAFSIPTSYIIDREGRILHKIVGPMDEEMMNVFIEEINEGEL
ncbi:redoxin domain-containing protein [Planococcus sp. CP5-4]|uniref:peroxiredoxin family protein n=1 Tax=unclassified Planococcus (in: firmicutes) TaxID=2662419 RepID=UPI001C2403B5|nr:MULTISPECIES: redoxin domain-containing protein [unclassified Planococcus (in: firmicutes)]MBU9673577.1 redoxin domain-containing protein [Planococcus sp. CP5-4_YE]MBV0907867.1 redoxin domain-containing protein [Planococcus sp. CP5-4_UN]MBW6063034.1 redoxin domain-containing protein [Planococcus sp. CP5-4]